MDQRMSDAELRDMAARAAMAAMGVQPPTDPFLIQEEMDGSVPNAGHHGYSEGGPGGGSVIPGCYSIESTEGGTITFANPYLMVGGVLYVGPVTHSVESASIVALKISATGTYSCELSDYGSVDALRAAQGSYDHYVIPLYQFDVTEDGEGNKSVSVTCDFRNIPSAAMGEFSS